MQKARVMKCETGYLADLGSKFTFQGRSINPTAFGQKVSFKIYVASQLQTCEAQDYPISTVVREAKRMAAHVCTHLSERVTLDPFIQRYSTCSLRLNHKNICEAQLFLLAVR